MTDGFVASEVKFKLELPESFDQILLRPVEGTCSTSGDQVRSALKRLLLGATLTQEVVSFSVEGDTLTMTLDNGVETVPCEGSFEPFKMNAHSMARACTGKVTIKSDKDDTVPVRFESEDFVCIAGKMFDPRK